MLRTSTANTVKFSNSKIVQHLAFYLDHKYDLSPGVAERFPLPNFCSRNNNRTVIILAIAAANFAPLKHCNGQP